MPVKGLFYQRNYHQVKELRISMTSRHYQILLWSLIDDDELKLEATDWGWKIQDGLITPIMSDKEVAPESLIKSLDANARLAMI